MADPVTLVILLAAGDASSPAAAAMAQGAHDAFAGAVTEIRETPSAPTDADALAAEGQSHPDAVAELLWRDADRRHATLRVHLRQSHRWIERSFTFAASDPATERGRTLGFAVASILPELTVPATTAPSAGGAPSPAPSAAGSTPAASAITSPSDAYGTPSAASPPSSTPSAAPASAPAPARASTGGPASASEPSPGSPQSNPAAMESARHADRPSRQNPIIGLDLLGVAASGLGGNANAAGGGGAVEWFLHRRLSLRLGAVARGGSLDLAQANVTTILTSAGAVFQVLPATGSEPFAVTVRVDYLLLRESARHYDGDESSPVTDQRWLSGVDTFLDGGFLLSSQIAAVVGFGLEDVLAPTRIYLKDQYVATLPALRAVVEGGFQLRF
jgi:hypothetical protein